MAKKEGRIHDDDDDGNNGGFYRNIYTGGDCDMNINSNVHQMMVQEPNEGRWKLFVVQVHAQFLHYLFTNFLLSNGSEILNSGRHSQSEPNTRDWRFYQLDDKYAYITMNNVENTEGIY